MNILITGGAGFIGSHLADELITKDYSVRVLDNLNPQVHGNTSDPPEYLNKKVEFIKGDVRDREILKKSLDNIDAVFHLAAAVGVGQSMYEIENYTSTNNIGTAVLLEELIKNPVEKLIVASSMSVYGEGAYRSMNGSNGKFHKRSLEDLKKGIWELNDKEGNNLIPEPTSENKSPDLSSIYALSKFDQEKMCLMIGKTYNIPTVALRFFNVYGPRQALSNPYTGVLAIFASRFLNNNPPIIYEDGNQKRDFVSVYDIASACRLALEKDVSDEVLNIGSGNAYTIKEIADLLASVLDKQDVKPIIQGKYRVGDIRHCFSDISRAKKVIGFSPQVTLENGLKDLARWLKNQMAEDKAESANMELNKRGLTI